MKYKVNDIQFDFEDDYGELPYDEQVAVIKNVLESSWYAEDEDCLVDLISSDTGWCIKSIDYSEV